MFKTDCLHVARAATFALVTCVVQVASAQTIAQVAEAQRAKLLADANPVQPVVAAPAQSLPRPRAAAPVQWRLHSIYTIGQKTSAEVLAGDKLVLVQPGASIGHYKVASITLTAITLETGKGCRKKCPIVKKVALGGTF